MGAFSMGPPPDLVKSLKDMFGFGTFVETGTLTGETTIWASSLFEQVYTIEASRELYDGAQERFRNIKNIVSLFGESGPELSRLLPTLPPTIFFLDAHWSGSNTAGAKSECPLLTELGVIMPWFRKHAVLIDDARLFLKPPPPPHQIDEWPSLDDIQRETHGATYTAVYKDVIVLVPVWHRGKVSTMLQALGD